MTRYTPPRDEWDIGRKYSSPWDEVQVLRNYIKYLKELDARNKTLYENMQKELAESKTKVKEYADHYLSLFDTCVEMEKELEAMKKELTR